MKNREDVASFIESQMNMTRECSRDKGSAHHYGWQNLRELMDFIYESEPLRQEEMIGPQRKFKR